MSTALALAGVTQVLRDLLNDRFVNANVAGQIGQSVTVSTLPPDKVVQQNGVEATQLNVFLRHITPNIGWRNEGLPSRDSSGRNRLSNPPLALNLHYLISAYGAADLHAEILLGYAMQMLHEIPVITRKAIQDAIVPPPDEANVLPEWLRALSESGLENQVEQLRITPEYLSTDDMSKFWTSTLAHYRPSAAYEVSVVLIQAQKPAPNPLPVLVRNISAQPDLLPRVPTIFSVAPSGEAVVVELGTVVKLKGSALDGAPREILLTNDRFQVEGEVGNPTGNATVLEFIIDANRADEFPVGVYRVGARVKVPGQSEALITNKLALTIAPKMTNLPPPVTVAGGKASFSLDITPAVRAGQSVTLVLGNAEFEPKPFDDKATQLDFEIPRIPGSHLARLRVDGIDSPIVDAEKTPPVFLNRRINIP